MHYVYVLKSQKSKRIYIGFTSDLRKRLRQHNNGTTKSTKYGIPWVLIYYEAYLAREDALARERQLKNYGSAYGFLKRRLANSLNRVLKERGAADG